MTRRLVDLLRELQERARRGMDLGLAPTERALDRLGNPHERLACVHVAGSNGKGSVSAMVEAIAREAGLVTGLYTSPHLCRFAERIRIGGAPIDDAQFETALAAVLEESGVDLTFFESLTVAAFVAFARHNVDLAVIEVGLGGRLDATNVIEQPLCTAITSIALEHTAVLGPHLTDIAREKAGILKKSSPVVLGPMPVEAEETITRIASEGSAGPNWRVGSEPGPDRIAVSPAGGTGVHVQGPDGRTSVARELGLGGTHQRNNAAVATGIAWRLAAKWPAIEGAIAPGLARVSWPGRMERLIHRGRSILLDCAHNPHATEALADSLDGTSPESTILVFGALSDKAWPGMIDALAPLATRRIYTSPRGREPASLDLLSARWPGLAESDPMAAIGRAVDMASPADVILVTGSSYLVGEVRGGLLGIDCDPIIAL